MAEAELKIPVFTVLKNGAILKNIFIVNREPPLDPDQEVGGEEEILVVGRHTNCSIVLTHPSVSRFHLQIYSNPTSQKLAVMDLSSVHGTWVSDKRIEPGKRVELTDGDTLRVGVSSRVYRLHWVPLSQAYDLDQSFVSASAVSLIGEKEEESSVAGEGKAVGAYQANDTLDIEYEELGAFNDPSEKREEKHSPFGEEGEEAVEALDDSLSKIIECEEVEKFADPLSLVEKENLRITDAELKEAFQDERSLATETEEIGSFEDPFSGKLTTEVRWDMLSEDKKVLPLNQISGDTGSLELVESSELPEKEEISETPNLLKDSYSSTIEDSAWRSQSETDPNQMDDPITCQLLDSDSMGSSFPTADQSQTDILKFDSENEVFDSFQISETAEIVESSCPSEKVNEDKGCSSPYSAFCWSESAPLSSQVILPQKGSQQVVDENLMSQQLYSEPQLPSEEISQLEGKDILSMDLVKPAKEPLDSSLSEQNILSDVSCQYVDKENHQGSSALGRDDRQSEIENLQSSPTKSSTKADSCSIWKRRGKPLTALQLHTGSNRRKSRTADFSSENGRETAEDKLITNQFADTDGEHEIFTPDKENLTPNTRKLKFLKEIGEVGVLHSRPLNGSSSKFTSSAKIRSKKYTFQYSDQENQTPMQIFTPKPLQEKSTSNVLRGLDSYPDGDACHSSDKENQTPESQGEHRRIKSATRIRSRLVKEVLGANERERMPFQSLQISSPAELAGQMGKKNVSGFISNNSIGERKKSWIMVPDTTSFLDKESRKTLQLLQGLRGTQLIIPRMVLSELDSLKRQRSLFRRSTDITSVLEWIEETMVSSKWWIHIQSSAEEAWAIAPTPRASPYSLEEASDHFPTFTACFSPFSFSGNSSVEIMSPTSEDRILEYALSVRKKNISAQTILLSNDVSLKIKAMAEGLLCETPKEFRESLVNPFSDRFMWAESSPRGQTWSLSDDVALKEKYFLHPMNKPSRVDDAKGLKLILRHNSQYGQIKSLS